MLFFRVLTCFLYFFLSFSYSALSLRVEIPATPTATEAKTGERQKKQITKEQKKILKEKKKEEKKYKKATVKKNKAIIKQAKKNNNAKNVNSGKKAKITRRQKKNIKKIERMEFLNDQNIIDLIDEQEKMVLTPKSINVRVKGKGVPSFCKKSITISYLNERKKSKADKMTDKELKDAKSNLKAHIKSSLVSNDVSEELIGYLMDHLQFIERAKKRNKEVQATTVVKSIAKYDIEKRAKTGIFYKKMYKDVLQDVGELFFIEDALILSIWAMETEYGAYIGDFDAFNALYSACINAYSMERLRYFEENIIALAMLVDRGYFNRDVVSSFDGGLGGCQFMPSSFYKFAVSMDGLKPDIINNNADVFASIGNYMHSMGWRYGEGILTEIEMPKEDFDLCLVGMDTKKSVGEWKKLGIKLKGNGVGEEYFINDDAEASLIITDINEKGVDKKDRRAFLVYDNFKVILGYNQHLRYGITAGLLFELIKNGK